MLLGEPGPSAQCTYGFTYKHTKGLQTHTHSWKFSQQILLAPLVEN